MQKTRFDLDTSGVAGFFGGDESVSGMASVHVYEGRRWLGWYNSPGSYTVAKRYGRLAKSRFWDGLFPGVTVDPTELFEYDGKHGPEFIGAYSGSHIKDTGHIGYLFLSECQSLDAKEIEGRRTSPVSVTIAELHETPPAEMKLTLRRRWSTAIAILPISTSAGACIVCGIFGDWYCFSIILLGTFASGLSCLAIGWGTLKFVHPVGAEGSSKGDGLLNAGADMVVMIGDECAVNSITRGKFSLHFSGAPNNHAIGLAALLLIAQFLLQLLLVPQGTLLGQIMFLATLAVSWVYSCYLSSLDREEIQRSLLLKEVMRGRVALRKYSFGTRTAMAVFVVLTLRPANPKKILDYLSPNDTQTWKIWKNVVLGKLERKEPLSFGASDFEGVVGADKSLLENLFWDGETAYKGYEDHQKEKEKEKEKEGIPDIV